MTGSILKIINNNNSPALNFRISIIAGYFMEEVMGYSAYNYIWEEDIEFAGLCQKLSKLPPNELGRIFLARSKIYT